MEQFAIFQQGNSIGTLSVEREGLFYHFGCDISSRQVLRIFVVSGWKSHYLGIPYPQEKGAHLDARIACSHFPDGISGAVASIYPKGQWQPWCGELDGVAIADALISEERVLALSPDEALKLPGWLAYMQEETVYEQPRMLLPLDADGTPLAPEMQDAASPESEQ
ncbi:MAG: hypothetical protein LBM28_06695 [Oscillospiraceae bacterium]|jgi:hypothetical protein|nr:hypothetical protein [Oscillospiraceae bacterium]